MCLVKGMWHKHCAFWGFKNLKFVTLVCVQAFVKMVGTNVSAMEEQVTQAETELGTLPSAFKKILRTMTVPGFLNVRFHDKIIVHIFIWYDGFF